MTKLKWRGQNQKLSIGVIREFHAAHWLNEYKGKCANIHGHTWKVECIITGERLNRKGFIIDFGLVKSQLDKILKEFDHSIVNFIVSQPTAENIAMYIYDRMYRWLMNYGRNKVGINYFLKKIKVHETENNFFEFTSYEYDYEMWFNNLCQVAAKNGSSTMKKTWDKQREELRGKMKKAVTKEERKKRSERMIKNNPMAIRANVERMMIALRKSIKIKPNVPEKKLISFFKKHKIDFEYTGDMSFLIDGKNPDFVNIKRKEIIELFGEFWHSNNNPWYDTKNDEKTRKKFFNDRGWKCLILWDFELDNEQVVLDKIATWRAE